MCLPQRSIEPISSSTDITSTILVATAFISSSEVAFNISLFHESSHPQAIASIALYYFFERGSSTIRVATKLRIFLIVERQGWFQPRQHSGGASWPGPGDKTGGLSSQFGLEFGGNFFPPLIFLGPKLVLLVAQLVCVLFEPLVLS